MDQVTDWNFSNGEERHFALVDGFAFSNPGSLVISQVGNSVRPMHLFGRQRPIMITTSNSPGLGSGMPNHYVGDLRHTLAISGLSHVSTRACGPRNFMKITQSRRQNGRGFGAARLISQW